MPVPHRPPWRIYGDLGPDATRELIRTLNEIGAAHRADLRAQAEQDRSHIKHLLSMQESRIRAHISDQVHQVTTLLYEQEHRWLKMLMWGCIALPVIAAFLIDALRTGR